MFLEYLEEDRVIDRGEGAAQVKQDQDTCMPTTVHNTHYSVVDEAQVGDGSVGVKVVRFQCGFFNRGLTMACFWLGGSTPSTNDALQMLAIVPDSTGHSRLTNQVGAGSDEHCLSSEPMKIFETSDGVVGRKTSRAGVARG